jgi:hypothetical protein
VASGSRSGSHQIPRDHRSRQARRTRQRASRISPLYASPRVVVGCHATSRWNVESRDAHCPGRAGRAFRRDRND